MLKLPVLQAEITQAIQDAMQPAIQQLILELQPEASQEGQKQALSTSNNISIMIAQPLGERLASAIDYYVHNISIQGTIMTAGSPAAQTAVITSSPVPASNGVVPNTLGIY